MSCNCHGNNFYYVWFYASVALPDVSIEWLELLGFTNTITENDMDGDKSISDRYQTRVAPSGITCRIKKLEIPSGVLLVDDTSCDQ